MKKTLKIILIILGVGLLLAGIGVLIIANSKQSDDDKKEEEKEKSLFTGEEGCDDANRRAITVTVSSDVQTRPALSLSQADMIFEVPSTGNSDRHTRLLAVYSCNLPDKVRSVRSGREHFADFSMAVDGVLAHWGANEGGNKYYKELERSGDLDRLDAAVHGDKYFPRDYDGVDRKEDSGTANVLKIFGYVEDEGWHTDSKFEGYDFYSEDEIDEKRGLKGGSLLIGFNTKSDRVEYEYDPNSNEYKRSWGGKVDIDGTNDQQIVASNILVMETKITSQSDPHYNNVTTTGFGKAWIYNNGNEMVGTWERGSSPSAKLFFYDSEGAEVKLVPGQTWVEVVEKGNEVEWTISNY